MKYLCLVYLDEKKLDLVPDRECKACGEGMRTSGHQIAAEAPHAVVIEVHPPEHVLDGGCGGLLVDELGRLQFRQHPLQS